MATEKRLISLDEALEATHKEVWWTESEASAIRSFLVKLPTVDAVEVVRCKDCKHYDNSEGINWCHLNSKFYPGGMDWHSFPEDGFCSYGERRTDGNK